MEIYVKDRFHFLKPVFFLSYLSSDVREKSHIASAFDGSRELPLVGRTHVSPLLCQESCMRIEKLLENFCVLIVDVLNIVLFEETLFRHN